MKVLKFGATWCKDCKIMGSRWKEIEKEYPWLETEYIGIDENPEAMKEYQILSLPSFIFLNKEGKEILRFSGKIEKETLVKAILGNKDK